MISFTVHHEDVPSLNNNSNNQGSFGRLLCEWSSPSSSSGIKYYTIEHKLGDKEWLSIGENIDKSQNQTELDILSLVSNDNNRNIPSRFRLKAHLENGKIFTSKPSDEIDIDSIIGKYIIIPDVEILSANSVQLTWKDNGNDKTHIYDIEKKEAHQIEWEKVTKVPLSQGSARIDNLIDAQQCQFRLVPSSEKLTKPGKTYLVRSFCKIFLIEDQIEPDVLTVHNVNEWLASLHLVPTSSNAVEVDISEEGFKDFDQYKVEYTTIDQLDQWQQV